MKKSNIIKYSIVGGISLAIILVVALRAYIFAPTSVLYNLFEADYASLVLVKVLKTVHIVAVGAFIIVLANLFLALGDYVKDNTVKTFILLIGSILKYVAAIAIVFVTLSAWGVDTTTLVTGAGVLTLVVGLGCQTLISDVVSGIFMLFEGDIKVGDVVVINGWRGTVRQIGLRRTKIEDTLGNVNIVNNSSISNIINNTRNLSLAVVDVGIEYNESIQRVESIIADNYDRIKAEIPAIKDGPYYKGVQELGASAVIIRLVAKCQEDDKYQVERDLNRSIKLIFDENNVNIPFDQIVVNYRDENETLQEATSQQKSTAEQFVTEQKAKSKNMDEQQN